MSIELVRIEIHRFLSTEGPPEVLCIRGKWGVGKTYSWKHFLKEAQNSGNLAFDRYAYVSLFGISSLEELKYAIFENTVPKRRINSGANAETFEMLLESPEVAGRKSARWLMNLTKNVPYLKYLNLGGAHRVFSLFIRGQVICIDDLDRKGKNLDIGDVLGLVSFLKEERGCKVVLLLNDDALPDDKKMEFRRYFEKVVNVDLNFNPTAEESVEIALQKGTKLHSLISEHCINLGISNIRIIRKIERLAGVLAPFLINFDERVLSTAVHSLTLLAWSVYAPESAPNLEFIKKRNEISMTATVEKEKTSIPNKEASWSLLLDNYGFKSMDDFDFALLRGVQNGYFDPAEIQREGLKLNEQISAAKSRSSFEQAWETLYGSFEDNQDEVLEKVYQSFFENFEYISPLNLNGTVSVFKTLGRAGQAEEMLKYYVENRKEGPKLFDLAGYPFSGIDDDDLKKAFTEKFLSLVSEDAPAALLVKMASKQGWNSEDIQRVSKLEIDEYYRIFKSVSGPELRSIIWFCLQFENTSSVQPEWGEISSRAKEALRRIAGESVINSLRVKRFGLALDDGS